MTAFVDVELPGIVPAEPVKPSRPARRWGVLYRAHGRVETWAVIEDVPAGTAAADVRAALGAWQHWEGWQRRVAPGGAVSVKLEPIKGAAFTAGKILSWDELAPTARRMSVDVPSDVWAAAKLAAANDGVSLRDWHAGAIVAALGLEL